MEETINVRELAEMFKKRIGLIIISMFIGLGIAGTLTFFIITPKYSSRAQLIVRLPQNETTNVNDINGNLQMINTYKDLITSDIVLAEVKQRIKTEHDIDLSIEAIKSSISVNQSQNSQMFSIVSTMTDSIVAQNIANQTSLVFQEKAKDMLNVDKITIISSAIANYTPVSPNNKLNLLIGLLVGLISGIAIMLILEMFDKTIKDNKFVEEDLGFTILGIVPNMTTKELNSKMVRSTNYSTSTVLRSSTEKRIDDNLYENNEERASLPTRKNRTKI